MRDYLNFDLLIEGKGLDYEALVLSSPRGDARSPFVLPPTLLEIIAGPEEEKASASPGHYIDRSSLASIQRFGALLFETVFQDRVRDCFHRSLDEAGHAGVSLQQHDWCQPGQPRHPL